MVLVLAIPMPGSVAMVDLGEVVGLVVRAGGVAALEEMAGTGVVVDVARVQAAQAAVPSF